MPAFLKDMSFGILQDLDVVRLQRPIHFYPFAVELVEGFPVNRLILYNLHLRVFAPVLDLLYPLEYGFTAESLLPISDGRP